MSREFLVYVTPSEFDKITSIMIGRDELAEAREVCGILGLDLEWIHGATMHVCVVPKLARRIDMLGCIHRHCRHHA